MKSLTLKYRPDSFETIVGQKLTVRILEKQIENNALKHCYLFCGGSGVGKTTLARAFAKKINHGVGDPIEMDCASANGVDYVRAIVDSASQRSLVGEYKIFILDEAHALTNAAWQAFLKCIEEPPEYTIFMFCTTAPNKIPDTILTRVQRFNLANITQEDIFNRLKFICQQEGFVNYEKTCELIGKTSNGSLRAAIAKLELCADYSTDLSLTNSSTVLGETSFEYMFRLTWGIVNKKSPEDVITWVEKLCNSGIDVKQFIDLYLGFVLDLIKFIIFKQIQLTGIPSYLASQEKPYVQGTVKIDNAYEVFNHLANTILDLKQAIKNDVNYKFTIEAFLLRECNYGRAEEAN